MGTPVVLSILGVNLGWLIQSLKMGPGPLGWDSRELGIWESGLEKKLRVQLTVCFKVTGTAGRRLRVRGNLKCRAQGRGPGCLDLRVVGTATSHVPRGSSIPLWECTQVFADGHLCGFLLGTFFYIVCWCTCLRISPSCQFSQCGPQTPTLPFQEIARLKFFIIISRYYFFTVC